MQDNTNSQNKAKCDKSKAKMDMISKIKIVV